MSADTAADSGGPPADDDPTGGTDPASSNGGQRIERSTRDTRLLIRGVTDIGGDYAVTLRAWRTRFTDRLAAVRAMGFDDRFVRMWEYYLALSEAGFATGISQDLQIVFEKRRGIDAGRLG